MSFTLHRLKKRVVHFVTRTADLALFIGLVLIGGIGSSWYMVDQGSALTTRSIGPWTTWPAAARTDADPYTRAHFARLGALPLNADVASTYFAETDSEGIGLHSSCDYTIEGREIANHWWSLAVFDAKGRLIPNGVERYSYTSDTVALAPDGTFSAALSRDARAGNWLPTGGAGKLVIAFTVLDLGTRAVAKSGEVEAALPVIKRKNC